jgi:hypothetical protein
MVMTIRTYKINTEKELATAVAAINALSNFKDSGTFENDSNCKFIYVITEA